MSTVMKGDQFESESRGIIKRVIEEEQLGHLAEHLKIYEKKKYFSTDRQKDIEFDLTIEVWPPKADRYVLIYFIECKDYKERVPVEKIERFRDQIRQVAGLNAKAIFITNSPLQEAAFNIAKNSGMMVIQGESSDNYKIILHKTNRRADDPSIPFLIKTYDGDSIDEGTRSIEKIVDKKILGILENVESQTFVSYSIDKLSKKDIEEIANEQLGKIKPSILLDGHFLGLETLKRYLLETLEINIVEFSQSSSLLGFCDFDKKAIGIAKTIMGTKREFFILGHEYGHYILHQKLRIGQNTYESFEDSIYNFSTRRYDLNNPKHWIEWQANYFASSLIMPKVNFLARVKQCQQWLGLSGKKIYLDDQPQNIEDFTRLIERLAYLFDTTKTSIYYKLQEMMLVNNQSRLRTIGEVIEEISDDLFM